MKGSWLSLSVSRQDKGVTFRWNFIPSPEVVFLWIPDVTARLQRKAAGVHFRGIGEIPLHCSRIPPTSTGDSTNTTKWQFYHVSRSLALSSPVALLVCSRHQRRGERPLLAAPGSSRLAQTPLMPGPRSLRRNASGRRPTGTGRLSRTTVAPVARHYAGSLPLLAAGQIPTSSQRGRGHPHLLGIRACQALSRASAQAEYRALPVPLLLDGGAREHAAR